MNDDRGWLVEDAYEAARVRAQEMLEKGYSESYIRFRNGKFVENYIQVRLKAVELECRKACVYVLDELYGYDCGNWVDTLSIEQVKRVIDLAGETDDFEELKGEIKRWMNDG